MNLLLLVLITTLAITHIGYCTATSQTHCNEKDREALLSFKTGLVDPSNRLASWVGGGDCCSWSEVVCHNLTGHVLELHLGNSVTDSSPGYDADPWDDDVALSERSSCLRGKMDASLLNLRHLRYLDLSNNDFGGSQIPKFFGSMQSLRYLNLISGGFQGRVPPQLGNLSNLPYLSIGYDARYNLYVENLHWLSGFSMLEHLGLGFVDLSHASDWIQQINLLSSLKELHLQDCHLGNLPQPHHINLSRLEILDLPYNQISSFSFLVKLNSLVSLDVSGNSMGGPIPSVLRNLTSLRDLDLSENDFNSLLPNWMNILGQLEKLKMGDNYDLQGVVVSDGMGNGTSLTHLDISGTDLQFEVKRSVKTICNLQWVDLSYSNSTPKLTHLLRMFLRCSSNRLHHLSLSGCRLSGPIPEFIGSLTSVKHLDLSDNQLSATIPTSIGQLIELGYLDLSSNSLQGTVSESFFANLARLDVLSASYNRIALRVGPDWNPPFQLTVLELSSWDLGPTFPEWLRSQHRLSYLELAGIGIKDIVPTWFWDRSSQFQFVNLSSNDLSGEISGQIVSARLFDMSSNHSCQKRPSQPRSRRAATNFVKARQPALERRGWMKRLVRPDAGWIGAA